MALAAAAADAEAEAAAASIWWVSARVTSLHRASPRFHTTFCRGGGKKRQRGVWKPGGALGDARWPSQNRHLAPACTLPPQLPPLQA